MVIQPSVVLYSIMALHLDNSIPVTRKNVLFIRGIDCTADWDSIMKRDITQNNSTSILLRE